MKQANHFSEKCQKLKLIRKMYHQHVQHQTLLVVLRVDQVVPHRARLVFCIIDSLCVVKIVLLIVSVVVFCFIKNQFKSNCVSYLVVKQKKFHLINKKCMFKLYRAIIIFIEFNFAFNKKIQWKKENNGNFFLPEKIFKN